MKTVSVHAEQVSRRLNRQEDKGIAGNYLIEVDDDVAAGHVAGVALDVFHENVAVACLDDFEFSVFDTSGKEMVEDDDYESYSGGGRGRLL